MSAAPILPMFDPPRFKAGDRVTLVHRGSRRETSVFEYADPTAYGDKAVHIWSPWLSINFVTVPESHLELIEADA